MYENLFYRANSFPMVRDSIRPMPASRARTPERRGVHAQILLTVRVIKTGRTVL